MNELSKIIVIITILPVKIYAHSEVLEGDDNWLTFNYLSFELN